MRLNDTSRSYERFTKIARGRGSLRVRLPRVSEATESGVIRHWTPKAAQLVTWFRSVRFAKDKRTSFGLGSASSAGGKKDQRKYDTDHQSGYRGHDRNSFTGSTGSAMTDLDHPGFIEHHGGETAGKLKETGRERGYQATKTLRIANPTVAEYRGEKTRRKVECLCRSSHL